MKYLLASFTSALNKKLLLSDFSIPSLSFEQVFDGDAQAVPQARVNMSRPDQTGNASPTMDSRDDYILPISGPIPNGDFSHRPAPLVTPLA